MVEWVHTYCTHPVGDLQGQPLQLPDWFIQSVVAPAFGVKKKNGRRKYQEIYQIVASGNAKSTLGTALALYCLCADKQISPRVYCVAGSKEQAGIIFNGVKLMVQQNEDLASTLKIYRNSIVIETEDYGMGILMAVSADSDMQEGLNPTAVFFDETHVQPNSKLYDNLKKNFAKRGEPLMFLMTTAGIVFTWAHEYHVKAVKIRDGIIKSPGFLPVIYEADPDGDDFDEAQWLKANPGWDYLNKEMIYQAAEDAKKSATALSAFRRYRLNKWVAASMTWLTDERWMNGTACAEKDETSLREFRDKYLTFEALKGRKCVVGLDLSNNRDTSAAVYIFPPLEKDERVKVIPRIYIPDQSLQERIEKETPLYAEWATSEEIIVTPGDRQDQSLIYRDMEEIGKIVNIVGVGYDSHNAGEIVRLMEKGGMPCRSYRQNATYMNEPMRAIDNRLSSKGLEHGGHPVMRWQCANTEAKTYMIGGGEFWMPTKSTELARIDVIVALIMAHGMMTWLMGEKQLEEPESYIKQHGVYQIKRK